MKKIFFTSTSTLTHARFIITRYLYSPYFRTHQNEFVLHSRGTIDRRDADERRLSLPLRPVSFLVIIFFIKGVTDHISNARSSCSHREGWYDFFANATSVTSDGFCDDSTIGMKHVAVRDAGRESTFKPNKNNMFPRPANWKPSKSNTHKEHFKN